MEACLATHLTLLCHAATRSIREGAFSTPDEPLDAGGFQKLARYKMPGPRPERMLTSPALAARQTADAVLASADVEPAIQDMDWGGWRGRTLGELHETDEGALSVWLSNPAGGTPGGETMEHVMTRVAGWLEKQARSDARIVAVTHAPIIRAVIALALEVPASASFNTDIAPLSATSLSFNRRWRLQEIRLP